MSMHVINLETEASFVETMGQLPADERDITYINAGDSDSPLRLQTALAALRGTNIRSVNLEHNSLNLMSASSLKIALSKLRGTRVTTLNLRGNDLDSFVLDAFPVFRGFVIEMADPRPAPVNPLRNILSGLEGTPVSVLGLGGNSLGKKPFDVLINVLFGMRQTSVTQLDLSNNEFNRMSSMSIVRVLNALMMYQITKIDLSGNDWGPEVDLGMILSGLTGMPVTELTLMDDCLCERSGENLKEAFSKLGQTSVTCVNLIRTLPLDDLVKLRALKDALPNIRTVYFSVDEMLALPAANLQAMREIFPNLQTVIPLDENGQICDPQRTHELLRRLGLDSRVPRLESLVAFHAARQFSRGQTASLPSAVDKVVENYRWTPRFL